MHPNDFCVFILTNNRADNVVTYATLKKYNYTGPVFLVVDSEDKSLAEYYNRFPKHEILVFDKQAVSDMMDEGNNFGNRNTVVYARNACFDLAERLGFTYFLQLDDDYTAFRYRYINKYITKGVANNLDRLFNTMLEFYKSIGAYSIAFAQGGDFIGGAGCSMLSSYTHRARKCMNTFFCSTKRPFKFLGSINEDVNTYTNLASKGALFLTLPFIGVEQKQTQSQTGGMTEEYARYGTYLKSFTSVLFHPSGVKVSMMISKNRRVHHVINWGTTTPMIIGAHYAR